MQVLLILVLLPLLWPVRARVQEMAVAAPQPWRRIARGRQISLAGPADYPP